MLSITLNLLLLLSVSEPDSSWRKQYDIITPTEDLFVVKRYYNDTINPVRIERKWKAGIVNRQGHVIVPLMYDDISRFSEGLAEVVIGGYCTSCWDRRECKSFALEGEHGFINTKGETSIPLKYKAVGEFQEGVAWVISEDEKFVFINKMNRIVFPYRYLAAQGFEGGLARVDINPNKNDYDGNNFDNYIDHTGKLLIPARYQFIEVFQKGELRMYSRQGRYGFLDTNGKEIVPPIYSFVSMNKQTDWQGLRMVGQQGKYGYIRKSNGSVVIPIQYDSIVIAGKNRIWVKKDTIWGAVDATNRIRIPFAYSKAQPFYHQLACVSVNGKWGYVDTNGILRIRAVYDQAQYFNEGLGVIKKGNKWGFVDRTGKEVIKPIYDYAGFFNSGKAPARWKFLSVTLDQQGNWQTWRITTQGKQFILIGLLIILIIAYIYNRLVKQKQAVMLRE